MIPNIHRKARKMKLIHTRALLPNLSKMIRLNLLKMTKSPKKNPQPALQSKTVTNKTSLTNLLKNLKVIFQTFLKI